MEAVIVKEGFVKVPNIILDEYIGHLPMPAFVVFLRLFRLSRGFNRDRCRVSLRALQKGCGLAQNTVTKALKTLLNEGFIEIANPGNVAQSTEYKILMPASKKEAPASNGEADVPHEMMQSSASPDEDVTQHNSKNTTTTVGGCEFKIDVSPLSAIGLTDQHASRFVDRHDAEAVQTAIDAFAFDLQFNKKAKSIKGSPLSFFIGIMMKGIYSPPENFESRMQKAQRIEREAKEKAEHEQIQIQTERNERRRAVLKKIVDQEFQRWIKKLSDKEQKDILPPIARSSSYISQSYLRSHFEEKVLKISLDRLTEQELLSLFQNVEQIIRPR